MKILLPIDGSAYTKKMLAYLSTHDEMFSPNHEYTLLNVQVPLPPRARAAVGADVAKQYYTEEADKLSRPVFKFLQRHHIEPTIVSKVGNAGETIAKVANSGEFDLVVMGSHGHSAFGNLVMGSVATQVLAHCKVPVLLVR